MPALSLRAPQAQGFASLCRGPKAALPIIGAPETQLVATAPEAATSTATRLTGEAGYRRSGTKTTDRSRVCQLQIDGNAII